MSDQHLEQPAPPDAARSPSVKETVIAGLRRLPDTRGALEALALFIMVLLAGWWAASTGVLKLSAMPRGELLVLFLSAFIVPALGEELLFRSWLRKGAPLAAVISLLAYIIWHPLQTVLHLPFGRPEFTDPRFLSLVAWLGLACTLSRIRSGSIWPPVIIHWGVVTVWIALYSGRAPVG